MSQAINHLKFLKTTNFHNTAVIKKRAFVNKKRHTKSECNIMGMWVS